MAFHKKEIFAHLVLRLELMMHRMKTMVKDRYCVSGNLIKKRVDSMMDSSIELMLVILMKAKFL